MAELKYIHTLHRSGEDDVLLGWATRSADTDGFYQWNGTGWTLIWELPGTDLIYDAVTWREKVFFCDGKHKIWVYDRTEGTICTLDNGPVVQYLIVHQDRLVGAGDARTQAEVEADTEVWPVDSNRDRVLFCEVLDYETWTPNNFIDCRTGQSGEVVSGLGINSITTSDAGAQAQLVIFKPHMIGVNNGTLGALDQSFNVISAAVGCPAYKTVKNTPYGLMFMSNESFCWLDTSGKEPNFPGFQIYTEFESIPDAMKSKAAAYYHNHTLKLAIAGSGSSVNNREWWLDLRAAAFPNEHNWYGPHSGDEILMWEEFDGELIAAQHGTTTLWKVDVEGVWRSMTSASARTSIATTNRVQVGNMKTGKLDAYGFTGNVAESVTLTMSADIDRGTASESDTWTAPATLVGADNPAYSIIRPLKRPGHDVQLTLTHAVASDAEIHSIYLRSREKKKQSEKQTSSTQA